MSAPEPTRSTFVANVRRRVRNQGPSATFVIAPPSVLPNADFSFLRSASAGPPPVSLPPSSSPLAPPSSSATALPVEPNTNDKRNGPSYYLEADDLDNQGPDALFVDLADADDCKITPPALAPAASADSLTNRSDLRVTFFSTADSHPTEPLLLSLHNLDFDVLFVFDALSQLDGYVKALYPAHHCLAQPGLVIIFHPSIVVAPSKHCHSDFTVWLICKSTLILPIIAVTASSVGPLVFKPPTPAQLVPVPPCANDSIIVAHRGQICVADLPPIKSHSDKKQTAWRSLFATNLECFALSNFTGSHEVGVAHCEPCVLNIPVRIPFLDLADALGAIGKQMDDKPPRKRKVAGKGKAEADDDS